MIEQTLMNYVDIVSDKIQTSTLHYANYISTENMLPNKGGVDMASSIPDGKVNHFKQGDTLFSNIRTYFKKVWLAQFDGGSSPDVLIFRTKNETLLHHKYLYYFLSNDEFINYTVLTARGAKMPRGDKAAIMQFPMQLPNIQEQKNTAKILSDLDKKIQLNQQINQTLEQMAQALFKSWFVDFEPTKAKIAALEAGGSEEDANLAAMQAISGKTLAELVALKNQSPENYQQLYATARHFPTAMQESELGEIPDGWGCLSLDKIANYLNGLALQKFRPEDEDADFLPVLKIAHLRKGDTDGEEKASVNIKPEYIVDNGDVIFSWSGSLLVDIWCGGKAALNQHLFKVTSDKYPKWLYYYYTKHHLDEFQRIAAYKAVTMGHIKRSHLQEAKCAIPSPTLLDNINTIFEGFVSKSIEVKLENNSVTQLRDTLLPKLLSGELSVENIETSN